MYNIGSNHPVPLIEYIRTFERALGVEGKLNLLPIQPGDVPHTFADVSALERDVGYRPDTPLDEGVRRFVAWYRDHYGV